VGGEDCAGVVSVTPENMRAADWEVRQCVPSEGRAFIARYHYARGCSLTGVYFHGLYRKGCDSLMGCAQWLPPTRVCAETVSKDNWRRVLSLSRLACHPQAPRNSASFLVGRSIRLIRDIGEWPHLVTFADFSQGHTGAIYRATGWTYVGETKANPRWIDPQTGRQVAIKSTKSRTRAEMIALGYVRQGAFKKHKFVMDLT
jgi:hypothetical protein